MQNSFKSSACFILLALVSHASFAETKTAPIGIKVGVAFDQGFGVTAQFEDKINVFLGNDGLAVDYLLKQGMFKADVPLSWYVGVGGVINWNNHYNGYSENNERYNAYSIRVPLGVSYSFVKNWDVYGQLAPDLSYNDKPHDRDFRFGVDAAFGIRYAF
ncbi:DUF3996 domain-containing protein [Psychromonas sp.]|nr:DUF3996 domain-containing protein [Psychromonas sp.]